MNLRNNKLVILVRVFLGLIFLMSGITGLMTAKTMQGVPPALIPIMQVLAHTGILCMIKITETVAGFMLVFGILPQLAAILVAPICVGVIIFNANTMPPFVVAGLIISALDSYLGYAYWDKYKILFQR